VVKKSNYYLEFPEHEWEAGHHWIAPNPIPVNSITTAKLIVESLSHAVVATQSVVAVLKYGVLHGWTGLPRMVYIISEDSVGEMRPEEYYGWDECRRLREVNKMDSTPRDEHRGRQSLYTKVKVHPDDAVEYFDPINEIIEDHTVPIPGE